MQSWLLLSFLAFFAYGFWGFFPKLAVQYMAPRSALFWEIIGTLPLALGVLFSLQGKPELQAKGIAFAMLTGIAGMIGTLFFFMAARHGKISLVVSITALYPLLTILLACLFLHEQLSLRQIAGMLLALLAIYLLSG